MFSLGYVYMFIFSATLPQMSVHFSVTSAIAQLTMTVYLLGFCLSQLIYAPISNAFGRKKALYFGSTLALIGTFLSLIFFHLRHYEAFLIARFIMALGACVGTVLAFTMIADVYSAKERKIRFTYLSMTLAIMLNLSIFTGGWIMKFFGIEGVFYFLFLFSLLVLYNIYHLPETAKEINIKHIHPKRVLKNYSIALKQPQLWIFALLVGCITASLYSFSTIAPFISVHVLKISAVSYGNWTLLTSLGIFFGPLCARLLTSYLPTFRAIVIFNLIALFLAAVMFILFFHGYVNVYDFFILTTFYYFLISVIFPNAGTLALQDATDTASSSSVFAFLYVGMSFLWLCLTSLLHEQKAYEVPLNFLLLMVIAALLSIVAKGFIIKNKGA
jgi:MFS family permease